jgi:2-oxoacid:acceptor oxidoreductase delta subunit (pyruvate/2-ketoisovalerate family)
MTAKDKNWKEASLGGVCWKASTSYLTGDWKTFKPVRDVSKCTKCVLCVLFCPDAAIHWNREKEDIEFDLDFCKGCGICANECPSKAIAMKIG